MIFTGRVIYLILKKNSRAIGLLSNARHYVSKYLLRTIYYSSLNSNLISDISQEKALRIINFKRHHTATDTLFKENKILKISDLKYIKIQNC